MASGSSAAEGFQPTFEVRLSSPPVLNGDIGIVESNVFANRSLFPSFLRKSATPLSIRLKAGSGEILLHAPDEDWVRREQGTVSLLHNLTIGERNTPFAQFESGLSTGVKHE